MSAVRVGIGLACCLGLVLAVWSGCGTVCGDGTVEVDGECVLDNRYLRCGTGFQAVGNRCEPIPEWKELACGVNAEFDEALGLCIGRGGGEKCAEEQCPPAEGGTICLAGRVFEAISLINMGADEAEPIGPDRGAMVRVYDPIAFVSNPTGTEPLAETGIYNEDGCFIVKSVDIPIAGFFAIAVDDSDTGAADEWAFAAVGETPTTGQNSENLEVTAVPKATAEAWGENLVEDGAMIAWFRNITGANEAGVTPTQDGIEPEASGDWEGSTLLYFNEDVSGFDADAKADKKTTGSGLVAIKNAPVKNYGGTKTGCTIESGLGGSAPTTLFFRIYDIEGC